MAKDESGAGCMSTRCDKGASTAVDWWCTRVPQRRTSWPKRATSCSLMRSSPRSVTPSRVVASGSKGVEWSRPIIVF